LRRGRKLENKKKKEKGKQKQTNLEACDAFSR
jgi:hypothetical protein